MRLTRNHMPSTVCKLVIIFVLCCVWFSQWINYINLWFTINISFIMNQVWALIMLYRPTVIHLNVILFHASATGCFKRAGITFSRSVHCDHTAFPAPSSRPRPSLGSGTESAVHEPVLSLLWLTHLHVFNSLIMNLNCLGVKFLQILFCNGAIIFLSL